VCSDLLDPNVNTPFLDVLMSNLRVALRGQVMIERESLPGILFEITSSETKSYVRMLTTSASQAAGVLVQAQASGAIEGDAQRLAVLAQKLEAANRAGAAVAEFAADLMASKNLLSDEEFFARYFAQCAPVSCSFLVTEDFWGSLLFSIAVASGLFGLVLTAFSTVYRIIHQRWGGRGGTASTTSVAPIAPPPHEPPREEDMVVNDIHDHDHGETVQHCSGIVP
jgi:hypothetical protein